MMRPSDGMARSKRVEGGCELFTIASGVWCKLSERLRYLHLSVAEARLESFLPSTMVMRRRGVFAVPTRLPNGLLPGPNFNAM
jgi:hypothetical protein